MKELGKIQNAVTAAIRKNNSQFPKFGGTLRQIFRLHESLYLMLISVLSTNTALSPSHSINSMVAEEAESFEQEEIEWWNGKYNFIYYSYS